MLRIDRSRVLPWLGQALAVALAFIALVRPGLVDAARPRPASPVGAAVAAIAPPMPPAIAPGEAAAPRPAEPADTPAAGTVPAAALADDPDIARPRGDADDRVAYEGPVAHIFFHSLIVYPRLAFTGDRQSRQFAEFMITRDQFLRILDRLHANDYILIDLRQLYDTDAAGTVSRRPLLLPPGKKPLVVSLDDLSYYSYMRGRGFAEKLVLDGDGRVATQVVTPEGERIVTRTGDAVPILDDFVRAHPDFSLDGAKGTIALTGFEGVLGYRTQYERPKEDADQGRAGAPTARPVDPAVAAVIAVERAARRAVERAAERRAVAPVIARLKAAGWAFASHSYSHNHKFRTGRASEDYVAADAARWREEVGALVGPTDIFIGPFGQVFKPGDRRRERLLEAGFRVLCGVGMRPLLAYRGNHLQMDRAAIDGYRLDRSAAGLRPYFDVAAVGGRGIGRGAERAGGGRPAKADATARRAGAGRRAGTEASRSGRPVRVDATARKARRAALAIGPERKPGRAARPGKG